MFNNKIRIVKYSTTNSEIKPEFSYFCAPYKLNHRNLRSNIYI